jgi:hypothetical protein
LYGVAALAVSTLPDGGTANSACGAPAGFLSLSPLYPMAIPKTVQHWLNLRREYERHLETDQNPPMPRVLPIVKIGRKWYFADERLKENRNVLDPSDIEKW